MKKTITAKAKSGKEFEVEISLSMVDGSNQPQARAILNNERVYCQLETGYSTDNVPSVVFTRQNRVKLLTFLGVPKASHEAMLKNKSFAIATVGDYKPVVEALRKKLAAARAAHVPHAIRASYDSKLNMWLADADEIGNTCDAIRALKERIELAAKATGQSVRALIKQFTTGSEYGEYLSTDKYEFTYIEMLDFLDNLSTEVQGHLIAQAEKQAKQEAEKQAPFLEAKAKGQPVLLYTNSGYEETRDGEMWYSTSYWAMPDGTTETTSSSTEMC